MIDEIGGEQEAIDWLEKKRGIKPNLPVINIDYIEKTNNFLGIQKFNNLTKYTNRKIICLGGIKKII